MPRETQYHAAAKATVNLSGWTLLSLITGLAAEVVLALTFGASAVVDAYRVTYVLIALGYQLFAFQILPNVIVPIFTEYRQCAEERNAWIAAMSFGNCALVIASICAVICCIWPIYVVSLLGPGLRAESLTNAMFFARWFVLTFIFMAWSGTAVGILYANGIFWPPMTASAAGNLLFVIAILLLGGSLGAMSLVIGILMGSVVMLILCAWKLLSLVRFAEVGTLRVIFAFQLRHPGVRKALRFCLPMFLTLILGFWGTAVIYRAISPLPKGALAIFGYAWKLVQMISFLPTALLTVMFPTLAASWCTSPTAFKAICTQCLRLALFVSIFMCCVAFAFRVQLISLLLQHGALSREAAAATARAFGFMLWGAPGYVGFLYLQKMFYATQDASVPTVVQLPCVILLSLVAPVIVSHYGLDGASALSGIYPWLASAAMLLAFNLRYRAVALLELAGHILAVLPIAAGATCIGVQAGKAIGDMVKSPSLSQLVMITAGSSIAAGLFCAVTLSLRMREALHGQRFVRSQSSAILRRLQGAVSA